MFVNLEKKKILVYGAGTIASRRIESLMEFGCALTVVAPEVSEYVQSLARQGSLQLAQRAYTQGEIPKETYLVLAATDRSDVNRMIASECRKKKIPVNVSSEKELCDFYFPGLAVKENVVIGVTAGGSDHSLARKTTEKVREVLKDGDECQAAPFEKRCCIEKNGKGDENG
jgi:siroheme synthase-like protein